MYARRIRNTSSGRAIGFSFTIARNNPPCFAGRPELGTVGQKTSGAALDNGFDQSRLHDVATATGALRWPLKKVIRYRWIRSLNAVDDAREGKFRFHVARLAGLY